MTTQTAERTGAPASWLVLSLLFAAALVLRVVGLDSGLWYDEIITLVESVRLPLYEIVTRFPGNNQHTLFSVLGHFSIQLFGEHPWSLRLPAALLGAATVPVLYGLARRVTSHREAVLACVLLASSYHHVWFSQNARGYSALAFLTLLSTWLLLRTLERKTMGAAAAYALAAALGVYAHLTFVFTIVGHAICVAAVLASRKPAPATPIQWRSAAMAFALAGLVTLLLYAPVLFDVKQFFVDRPSPMAVATPRWAALELLRGLQIGLGAGIGAMLAATLLVAGLWSYVRQSWLIAGLFVLPGVVTVAGAVALQRPIFPRFLFFLIGFGLLIIVRGASEAGTWLARTRGPIVATGLVAAITVVSLYSLLPNYRYPKQDFEGAMQFVESSRREGDVIATAGLTTTVYRDYYSRAFEEVPTLDAFSALRARAERVWVLYTLEGYIASQTPDLMQALRADCAPVQVFRGTVGNGDITVCMASTRQKEEGGSRK